jgi:hypothetical protein
MTAIADSAATGRATGTSSPATLSTTGRIRTSRAISRDPAADFQRAVQYIAPDGHRASAAEASFLTLSHARGKGIWLALYRRLPGFAAIAELAYAFIAAHRSAFIASACFCGAGTTNRRDTISSHSVPAPVRADLPVGLRLLRRAGAGADRQPWHPAAGELVDAVAAVFGRNASSDADGVLVERQRFRHPGRVLGGAALSLLLVFNLLPRLSLFCSMCSISRCSMAGRTS